jgi:thioredoxin reductase (NADPH)
LKKIGIAVTSDDLKIPTYNENSMESNMPGIYLAGVICGGMETHKWFIENSRIHAKMIAKDIVKKKKY